MVIVGNDQQFKRFCETAGIGNLVTDPRFQTNAVRVKHADTLSALISQALATRRVDEWLPLFEKADVACGPINNIAQVFADPQVVARQMLIELAHPLSGKIPGIANPIRFSESPIQYDRAPPLLGQHTAEVLEEILGLKESEIVALKASGAIG